MTPQILALFLAAVSVQDMPLPAGGTLSGLVRDPRGDAIPGAQIDVSCGAATRHATANQAGEFRLTGLPAVPCTAVAAAPMFESSSAAVDLSRGRASATITLQVRGYATEVVVTPGRGIREDGFDLPDAMSVTTRRDRESRPFHLLPHLLQEEPGVLVQQTTSAQASPTIRGFTGQSNVYLVDGVRLNTAAWRSGPSQYLGWVDTAIAERIEVVRGPGSVEYGSDALGGTINVLTPPSLFSSAGTTVGGGGTITLGSADRSAAGEGNLHVRLPRASFRGGVSRQSVGDLRPGGGEDSHASVTRYLGLPSSVIGSRLRNTGYDQAGAFAAGGVDLGGAATLNALFTHSNQTGASRYDRILGGDGNFRSGFDPQTLDFGLLRYQRPNVAGLDGLSATFSLNRQSDGRYEQARPTTRIDRQQGVTTVLGYQVQGHRVIASRHRVLAGAEFYDERTSASRELLEPTGVISPQRPDIPDGTAYRNFGAFVQDSVDVWQGRLNLRGGVRYGRFAFETERDERLGVTAERVTTDALTFQAGTVLSLTEHLNIVGKVSRGFRAANAADLGDIGLSGGGGFGITPSKAAELGAFVGSAGGATAVSTGARVPALRPEVVYSYEAGLKFRSRHIDAMVTAYDLEYLDTIQRRALVFDRSVVGTVISGFEIVRQDGAGLAYIAQDVRPIATRVNLDRARTVGFDVQASVRIARQWSSDAHFSMANGRLLDTDEFLRRMPPPMGGARLRWQAERAWVEGAASFARTQTRLNSGDLTDARIGAVRTRTSIANFFNGTATDLGLVQGGVLLATGETLSAVQTRVLGTAASAPVYTTGPGYVTFGLRAGWQFADGFEISAIGENLTDRNYRVYGSGLDSPGINVHARLRYRF